MAKKERKKLKPNDGMGNSERRERRLNSERKREKNEINTYEPLKIS